MTCRIREKNYGYRTPPVYSLRVSIEKEREREREKEKEKEGEKE